MSSYPPLKPAPLPFNLGKRYRSGLLLLPLAFWVSTTGPLAPCPAWAQASKDWTPQASEFIAVDQSAAPAVSYAVRGQNEALELALRVEMFGLQDGVRVEAGLHGDRTVKLANAQARIVRQGKQFQLSFRVPAQQLWASGKSGEQVRLAFAVAWESGIPNMDRQREQFLQLDGRAPSAGLSPDPAHWTLVDLKQHAAGLEARANSITIPFVQPTAGKATIVIEDAGGRRVRNLISGVSMPAGKQQIPWDGLDDDGQVVPPGAYRWRAISHAGLTPRHLMTFADGPASNHGVIHAATSNGDLVFVGTSVSEGGHQLVGFDCEGRTVITDNPPLGAGLSRTALAASDSVVYMAKDGPSWGDKVDKTRPNWKQKHVLSLFRYDIRRKEWLDFPGKRGLAEIGSREVGPGSPGKLGENDYSLRGMALLGGKLYIASRHDNGVLAVLPDTGERTGLIPLPGPGDICTQGNGLLAISDSSVVKLDPATGKTTPLIRDAALEPAGLACGPDGAIYVSDRRSQTVKVFNSNGALLRTLGQPGGAYKGQYKPDRLVNPAGLALGPGGNLWVTEERVTPKRYVVLQAQSGKVVREYFGRAYYGSSGGGMDREDQARWVGQGAVWQVDLARRSAVPTSVLGTQAEIIRPTHYRFYHQDGRTFLIAYGKCTFIMELMADGSARDLAMIGTQQGYRHGTRGILPAAWEAAAQKAGLADPKTRVGVLWVDQSGDGLMQPEEFSFARDSAKFGGGYWGSDFADLRLRVPAVIDGKNRLVVLEPQGFYPGGAPKYPALDFAINNAVNLETVPRAPGDLIVETMTDRFGNTYFNSTPKMVSFDPQGKLRWNYPNRWTGVGGSHSAPLPETGVLQGTLNFTGMAPLDEKSDVFAMIGNHGRVFLITSDGLYVDEMFRDVRLGGANDMGRLGGECFGGFFEKSQKDCNYYLQAGGSEYRIYRVEGMNTLRRSEGSLNITAQNTLAAQNLTQVAAAAKEKKVANIPFNFTPIRVDGRLMDWKRPANISWNKEGQFPVALRMAHDETNLYLAFTVKDPSPWVNNGKDWQTLFKTGDSVDLQLGTNEKATPGRKGPEAGDIRILIAPMGTQNVAVLYRHRKPGAPNPVHFTSPWRSETVDVVTRLEKAQISVERSEGSYTVEVAIPWAELELNGLSGKDLPGDVGVIYGDDGGTINTLRNYWSNLATGLVDDVPGEIMLFPNLWGQLHFDSPGEGGAR